MATELANPQTDRTALSDENTRQSGLNVEGQYFEIAKSVNFEAAHRLPARSGDDPYGRIHGHSFELEVTIGGQVEPGKLWVEDIAVLTAALGSIAGELDHQLLNDIEGLSVPTLENILVWAANRLSDKLDNIAQIKLSRPSLKEVCVLRLSAA